MMRTFFIVFGLMACTVDADPDTDEYDTGPCDCGAIYAPVCADGTTYGNECVAICDGIIEYVEGACDD